MKKIFTNSFKIQAVEKALNRNDSTTLKDIALSLGIGGSTLDKRTEGHPPNIGIILH